MQNIDMNLLMQLLRSGSNPQALIENLAKQNPQMNAVLQQVRQSGMSMRDFTVQYAKQNNIDLQAFTNMMQQMGIK